MPHAAAPQQRPAPRARARHGTGSPVDRTTRGPSEDLGFSDHDRLRIVGELSPDAIFRYRLAPTRGIDFVSSGVERMTGYPPSAFIADPALIRRIVHVDDAARLDEALMPDSLVAGAEHPIRWVRRDGSITHTEQRLSPVFDGGTMVAIEGVARDVTAQVNAIAALRASEARFRSMVEDLDVLALALAPDGRITFVNSTLARLTGWPPDELIGLDWYDTCSIDADRGRCRAGFEKWLTGGGDQARFRARLRVRDGGERIVEWVAAATRGADGRVDGVVRLGDDVTDQIEREADRARSAAALDQMAESVVITDPDANIVHVNPAFERVTGYTRAEVLGRNPRILSSGQHDKALYQAMWRRLTSGATWTGELVNRRKDGSLFVEEASITPVRDDAGRVIHYVAVKRDVTAERAALATLDAARQERLEVARLASQLEAGTTPEETARRVTAAVLAGVSLIDHAAILTLEPGGASRILWVDSRGPAVLTPGESLPRDRALYLRDRSATGPWTEAWQVHPDDGVYQRRLTSAGFKATAYAPIGNGDGPVALLAAATLDEQAAHEMVECLPALAEIAATIRPLLVPALVERWEHGTQRERILRVIREHRFASVFQPIANLATGHAVGFEALTRFQEGRDPATVFEEARIFGLEADLEEATLRAAIEAAAALPPDAWLSLNVSASLITGGRLEGILAGATRRIVLEVTEHESVVDYAALRSAVDALRPSVEVAADDAGAGIANFSHLVELRPRYVKVDISLVRGINADVGRQALAAALKHFSVATDCALIAEGVETPAELVTLAGLGVDLAQGYLIGRPAPAESWTT